MAHKVERKRVNKAKNKHLDPLQWADLFRIYQDGHSVCTLATLFNIDHSVVTEKLRSFGIYRPVDSSDKSGEMRRRIIPRGKYADSDFLKK